MTVELLDVAWRAHQRPARSRLVLCAVARAADDVGKAELSVTEIAKAAGLPLRSALLSLYELKTAGLLDVAFAQTLAHGDQPDQPQTLLLNVPVLRERAGMLDDVDDVTARLSHELGARTISGAAA